MIKPKAFQWQIITESVRGASHIRSERPNQDAVKWTDIGHGLIAAVADGHGSARCFRSHIGSQLAVDVGVYTVQDFLSQQAGHTNLTMIKRLAEEQLGPEIVRRWQEGIRVELDQNPPDAAETALLKGADPLLAYGATLLITVVTRDFIIYWQLGDGDIVLVDETGQVMRPLPADERLIANETTSLCQKDAWRHVRFRFQPIAETPPDFVMLATDGYANSFRDDTGFLKAVTDLHDMIQTEGPDYVRDNLAEWLNEASRQGSGDDITAALLWPRPISKNNENATHPTGESDQ